MIDSIAVGGTVTQRLVAVGGDQSAVRVIDVSGKKRVRAFVQRRAGK